MIKKLLISILILYGLSWAWTEWTYYCIHNSELDRHEKLNQIFEGDGEYDVVYFGSSRAAFHFDPSQLNLNGLKQYNCGIGAANALINLGTLKTYLKSHSYVPKYLVLNIDFFTWSVPEKDGLLEYQRYLPYLHNDDLFSALAHEDSRFWFFRYCPPYALAHMDDWYYYETERARTGSTTALDKAYSKEGYQWTIEPIPSGFDTSKYPINRVESQDYLHMATKEIFELCDQKGIKVIPVVTPIYKDYKAVCMGDSTEYKKLQTICAQNGSELIDYSNLDLINDKENFADLIHLNRKGVQVFSEYLEKDLQQIIAP